MRTSLILCSAFLLLGTPAARAQEPGPPADGGARDGGGGDPADGGGADAGGDPADGGAQDGPGKRGKRGKRGQPQDPERAALLASAEDVLHAKEIHVDDEGFLVLRYAMATDEELQDWELAGFERAAEGAGRRGKARRGNKKKGKNLSLGVGSREQGLLRHRLKLSGDFEVTFTLRVIRSSTESDLVLGVGKAGARFGTQLVKRRSSGFAPLERGSQPDLDPFARGRSVSVVLKREGGMFSARAGAGKALETDALSKEAQGPPLLYAHDMLLTLESVELRAKVDKGELDALAFE